jgi:hypothetical protein
VCEYLIVPGAEQVRSRGKLPVAGGCRSPFAPAPADGVVLAQDTGRLVLCTTCLTSSYFPTRRCGTQQTTSPLAGLIVVHLQVGIRLTQGGSLDVPVQRVPC